jgi:ATP-dependent Clp protease ATP-binding subunit ClpC
VQQYLFWHYTEGRRSFLRIWKNYLEYFWHFYSVKLLARTLFSYWHRDITFRGPGFDMREFFQTLAFNLLSRGIGAIVRLLTIIFALLVELVALAAGAVLFLVWLIYPLFVFFLLFLGFLYIFKSLLAALLLFISAGAAILIARICFITSIKKMPSEIIFEEAIKEPWFDLVWERIGISSDEGKKIPSEKIIVFLEERDLSNEDFNEIVRWTARQEEEKRRKKMFWLRENLLKKKGIGKDWAYGYTNNLNKFSIELSRPASKKFAAHLIAREKEIETIERILSRARENNVLLIGEPGIGRKTIIKGFAELVFEGNILPPLKHKKVLEINLNEAMAGSMNESEMEARIRLILNEAVSAGNIILAVDDFHNFASQQSGLGKIDISGILMPYLNSRYLQIIATTTHEGFHKYIEANSALLKFFEKIEVSEPDEKNTILILEDVLPQFEAKMNVRATYVALKEIVSKANRYFSETPMPERAIDLLEESMIYTATKTTSRFLEKKHVDLILSEKTKIPIGEASFEEKEKLFSLEEILHQRIIGQEEAIKEISSAMLRARAGVADTKKPIGSFLFLGPTGVGKTETAKALAEGYFGDEEKMVRLDMSEYQNISDVYRLIGAPKEDPGYLAPKIRENPFSLLLLDEVEKAHKNILNLFLQVLDEGCLTDGWGRKVNFRNNIIIATSNAGAELIRQMVSQNIDPNAEKQKIINYLQENNLFTPEFLNRFDGIIVFHPLSKRELLKVAKLLIDDLNRRLAEKKISLGASPELLERIVELGYNPEYGARPMKRVIQNKIEDLLSKKILSGNFEKNQVIEIRPEEI